MTPPAIETVHQSLQRCYRTPGFINRFYETFLAASPAVARHFAETDMARQVRMVEASLYTSLLAAEGVPYAVASIKRLGEKHRDLGIQPPLFALWRESLLQTIAACDAAWGAGVEAAWRTVLQDSIDRMLALYPAAE